MSGNPRSRFSVVALDVDGTLVTDDKHVQAFTKRELIRVACDYGVQILLLSSRMPESIGVVQSELGIDAPFAAYNGSLVVGGDKNDQVLVDVQIPADDVTGILACASDPALHTGIFTDGGWFVSEIDYWALREARGCSIWPEAVGHEKLVELAHSSGHCRKIMLRGDGDKLDTALRAITSLGGNTIEDRNSATIVEITSSLASKSQGMRILANQLNFDLRDVVAFGDGVSDLTMLQDAGLGVAMGNASDVVKGSADRVTLSNNEDGVGLMLRNLFPSDTHLLDLHGE
jgi:Cof subfamily protein (haloacid dehalogenase superfamily)